MLRQNELINRLQLPRIADDRELLDMELREVLVPLTESPSLRLSVRDDTRRYSRPWTRQFIVDISEAYYREFGKPLWVTSLVRTVEQQHRLRRRNRNAAPAVGDVTSSHLAGVAVDIAKNGMTLRERRWVDQYVLPLQEKGLVEAAEERRQACYHIMVYDLYMEKALANRESAASMPPATAPTIHLEDRAVPDGASPVGSGTAQPAVIPAPQPPPESPVVTAPAESASMPPANALPAPAPTAGAAGQ